MSVLPTVPKITSVYIKGLDDLKLPLAAHALGDETLEGAEFFPFLDANNDQPYYIKSVTGLEPPDREIAIASTASGGDFQGATTAEREVVVLLGLNPRESKGETPSLLRQRLYTMLTPGYDPRVDIQLVSGIIPVFHEYAYVSKFEADIFTANPVVQITFTTLNPTFRGFDPTYYDASSLSEAHPNVYNFGTAETGFKFAVKFTGTKNGWFIRQSGHKNIGMTFDETFHDGDILSVCTIPGNRYVHLKKHRAKVKNALEILTSGSEWVQLHPGSNHFVVTKKTSVWDWHGRLSFTAQYWGV
jgi:hypothetical protein